jgi:hypothetical protein
MPLEPLSTMSRTLRKCPPPSFDWKGGDPDEAVGEINEGYIEAFKQVNAVADVGYVVAAVEWIYWYVRDRLDPEDAADYQQYIVAHWFWLCDLPRKVPPAAYRRRSKKPPRDAVCNEALMVGLETISNSIMSVRDDETAVDAAFMSQLCEYIFPKECGFNAWRIAVLDRLIKRFPADREHYDTVRVSRRFFDIDIDLSQIDDAAEYAATLSNAELARGNRYLPLKRPD